MTLMDIIIKIALFFGLFYGAVALTALISNWIKRSKEKKKS